MSLKASRTSSKIDDICRFLAGVDMVWMFLIPRVLAGVDDDIDVPDWDWCP